MAHYYDDWNRKVSRKDIADKIEAVNNSIKTYENKEKLLEEDLENVNHEISRELLKNESDKMVRWRQAYQNELIRLNKLLSRFDEGVKITNYELN
jgi:predicted DNA-binding protein YlxM (UPF0122 family)